MNKAPLMKENEFSIISKLATMLIVLLFIASAIINVWRNRSAEISAKSMAELGKHGIDLSLDIYSHIPDNDE